MGVEVSKPEDEDIKAKLRSIRAMDDTVRSRVRAGVQYNMKVVIRGEPQSGKTTLWKRLQGMPFCAQHEATSEIQTATINWSFKSHEDNVKVEVWDIVDQGFSKTKQNVSVLDASVIDVYKGTHAVIFMINPFSKLSFEYARNMSAEVPPSVAILFLINFRDGIKPEHYGAYYRSCGENDEKIVSLADVMDLVTAIRKTREKDGCCTVFAIEASLYDCWGLVELDKFFNVPFLALKKVCLQEQLMRTEQDLHSCSEEVCQRSVQFTTDGRVTSIASTYESHHTLYMQRRQISTGTGTATVASVPEKLEPPKGSPDATSVYSENGDVVRRKKKNIGVVSTAHRDLERVDYSSDSDEGPVKLKLSHDSSGDVTNSSSDMTTSIKDRESTSSRMQPNNKTGAVVATTAKTEVLDSFSPTTETDTTLLANFLEDAEDDEIAENRRRIESCLKVDESAGFPTDEEDKTQETNLVRLKRKKKSPRAEPSFNDTLWEDDINRISTNRKKKSKDNIVRDSVDL